MTETAEPVALWQCVECGVARPVLGDDWTCDCPESKPVEAYEWRRVSYHSPAVLAAAKAEGLREAAEHYREMGRDLCEDPEVMDVAAELDDLATDAEKGTDLIAEARKKVSEQGTPDGT